MAGEGEGEGEGVPDEDGDGYTADVDCDDTDASIHPDAAEVCDGVDNNSDGDTDEGVLSTFYTDADGDGFGDPTADTTACDAPSDHVSDNTDCDDADPDISPAAIEVCDERDNNCDGTTDEGVQTTFYADTDSDGYGDAGATTDACAAPSGYTTNDTDCDDTDGDIYPGATEVCDGVDNDCDASTSEDGLVALTDSTGVVTDVTSTFAGTHSTFTRVQVHSEGTYTFCDGTYNAPRMDLYASATFQSIHGAASTILDAQSLGQHFLVNADAIDLVVDGLTLTNGSSTSSITILGDEVGGSIACAGASSLTLTDSVVDSSSGELGGAVALDGCDATVSSSTLESNEATFGGGLFARDATVSLEDTTLTGNTASGSGGGLYLDEDLDFTTAHMSGGAITANEANYGGALSLASGAEFSCWDDGALTDNTSLTSNDRAAAVYFTSTVTTDASHLSAGCDWGDTSTGDDNDPADVGIYDLDTAYDAYAADAWFRCDSTDGCGDELFAGATARASHLEGSSTSAGVYSCETYYDDTSVSTDNVCSGCDFAFTSTWTLDTAASTTSSCTAGTADFEALWAVDADYDGTGSAGWIYGYEYYGSTYWYPFGTATVSDWTVSWDASYVDDYSSGYYSTFHWEADFELY